MLLLSSCRASDSVHDFPEELYLTIRQPHSKRQPYQLIAQRVGDCVCVYHPGPKKGQAIAA
jgi:hypothetical protein